MRWIRFAVFVVIVTILQAGLVDNIAITTYSVKPDLLLILLVFFAIYCNTTEAIITSFSIGFAADIIGSAMGPQIISFGLFGTLLAYLHRVMAIRRMPYQSIAIFIVGFLVAALTFLLMMLKHNSSEAGLCPLLFGIPLYSAIVGPFLFLPFAWWMRIKISRFSQQ